VPRRTVDVLLVDDDPSVAETTAEVLGLAGFTTLIAPSAGRAVAVLADIDVGVVIVDHHLADSPTFATGATPPVILMSGLGRDEIDNVKVAHGDTFFAYLAKPVPPDSLVKVVGEALGR
jgi:DNA-binding response OmpR family regulator